MKTTTSLAFSALLSGAAASGYLEVDLHGRSPAERALYRRDVSSTAATAVGSAYFVNMTIGTPPQSLALQLDTGSSDLWALGVNVPFCKNTTCRGGFFDQNKSTSYELLKKGGFASVYGKGYVKGDAAYDTITIAGYTVKRQRFSVANETDETLGIFGVGYSTWESVCALEEIPPSQCQYYPSFVDNLVKNGDIAKKVYSIWLGDVNNTAGVMTFGGIDSSKYTGDLVVLPLNPYFKDGTYETLTVSWTNASIGTPNGPLSVGWGDGARYPTLLDTGTTLSVFPLEVATALYTALGAERVSLNDGSDQYVVDCNLLKSDITLDFSFGGPNGITIKVPIREWVLQADGATPFANGDIPCQPGFTGTNGTNIILGDTFLRSVYAVYDLTDNQIALAQANFNPGSPSIQTITAKSIPGAVRTASAFRRVQVTTASTYSITTIPVTGSVAAPSGYALQSFITGTYATTTAAAPTGSAASAATGASGSAAASSSRPGAGVAISPSMEKIFTAAFGVMLAVSGAGILLL